MGVTGLIPFIRKTCPGAITVLPNRFKELCGKNVVIDGTLITQRLHFAPSPHPYRHVLGWYRLVTELHESNVSAICVFDGKARHSAKAREGERRRAGQRLTSVRGKLENERLHRLQLVNGFLMNLSLMPHESRARMAVLLQSLNQDNGINDPKLQDSYRILASEASSQALAEISSGSPDTSRQTIETGDWKEADLVRKSSSLGAEFGPVASSLLAVPTAIATLFLKFKNSAAELASIAKGTKAPGSLDVKSVDDGEVLMTKAQSQLAVMERNLWRDISHLTLPVLDGAPHDYEEVMQLSNSLVRQSLQMSDSFKRRSNLPNAETYAQSREILNAMGIQCLQPDDQFEGEALASSMVLNGSADYVVSEDTDVLVYGAPLIRNITSSNEPLEIVSAKYIQDALALDRQAYIDFALLLGTDFSQRIKNLGPARALKFIKEYGTIERIIASETKYPPRIPSSAYLAEIKAARSIFNDLPAVPDIQYMDPVYRDDVAISSVLQRYKLGRALMRSSHWDPENALSGNYFGDNPTAL